VHQVVCAEGRWYAIAWCEKVSEMRRFRADRILDARLLAQVFRPQLTFKPVGSAAELLQADEIVRARVAFSARIARWLKEKHPGGQELADGRYVVTYEVADPAWFAREVLQYGAEAEVLEPEGLREAVRKVVA
jgi:predicted DNA-binding transcriptional regulator YafY